MYIIKLSISLVLILIFIIAFGIPSNSESLRNLLALKPKYSVVIRDGRQCEISSDEIVVGDIVTAKPGEKISTDSIVVDAESSIDESLITGESTPVEKQVGIRVIGGTINKNGYLQFKATNVGNDTVLSNIIEMVRRAKMSKAPIQRIADRAVQYFIPIILSIAIGASLYWILLACTCSFNSFIVVGFEI